jgi:2,3-bisphosphoglycerate-dependent phosphoglycerate mutase
MTKLVIIRHGNTFAPGEEPRRVGGWTDLPLVPSGLDQAAALGQHFKEMGVVPDVVFTSHLQRTRQTAQHILLSLGVNTSVYEDVIFNEIDYGPDENQPEEAVRGRIGQDALDRWDREGIVPEGWGFSSEDAIQNWQKFADRILIEYPEKTVFVVTSNGIARFAPYLTGDFSGFCQNFSIKLSTGAYGILVNDGRDWAVSCWNNAS